MRHLTFQFVFNIDVKKYFLSHHKYTFRLTDKMKKFDI